MDLFPVIANGFIRVTPGMLRRLCFFGLLRTVTQWRNEDIFLVEECEHENIEQLLDELTNIVIDIENDENNFYNYRKFGIKLTMIVDKIEDLK
jgi:hypothetical protein